MVRHTPGQTLTVDAEGEVFDSSGEGASTTGLGRVVTAGVGAWVLLLVLSSSATAGAGSTWSSFAGLTTAGWLSFASPCGSVVVSATVPAATVATAATVPAGASEGAFPLSASPWPVAAVTAAGW